MATGTFQGWIWCNDGTTTDPTAFAFTPGGLHGTAANTVVASNIYLWRGVNEWLCQFNLTISASNLKQAGWGTFDSSSSGARGTRGDAFGAFAITTSGATYRFLPTRVFGYYDGATTIKLFVTAPGPAVS